MSWLPTWQTSNNLLPERFKWQAGYSQNKTTTGSARQESRDALNTRRQSSDAAQQGKNRCKFGARLLSFHSAAEHYWPNLFRFNEIAIETMQQKKSIISFKIEALAKHSKNSLNRWLGILWKVTAPSRYNLSNFKACPGRLNNCHLQLGEGMSTVCSCAVNCVTSTITQFTPESGARVKPRFVTHALWDALLLYVLGLGNEHVNDLLFVIDCTGSCDLHDFHNLLSDL